MDNNLFQLLLSGKLGDGCFINQRKVGTPTYRFNTNSVNLDYVLHKKSVCINAGLITADTLGYSGYTKNPIHGFRTYVCEDTTLVGSMTIDEVLDNLDLLGLIYFYLDDGSLHKHKYFMHLYCCKFTHAQAQKLSDIIFRFYPQKRCSLRTDRKKDGREFPYLYIPVVVAREFSKDVYAFLNQNQITSLLYKTVEGQAYERV